MSLLFAILGMLLGILFFLVVWRLESGNRVILSPFVLLCGNEMLRNWPAGLAAPWLRLSSDFVPLWIMLAGFFALLAGFAVSMLATGYRASLPVRFRDSPILVFRPQSYVIACIVAAVLLTGLGLVLFQGPPPVTQSLATLGSGVSVESALGLGADRQEITKSYYFGGEYRGQGLLRTLMQVCWPILTGVALVLALRRRSPLWWTMTAGLFALMFLFVAGDGTRGPFLWCVIYLLVLVSMIRELRMRTVVTFIAGIFALAIAISVLSPKLHRALESGQVLSSGGAEIASRILLGNGVNTVSIVELVRSGRWEYRLGKLHYQRFANAIPGVESGEPFAHELYRTLNPGTKATTYNSATYIGDAFLDFGVPGVVIAYFIFGVGLGMLQRQLFRAKRTPARLAFLAFLTLTVSQMTLSGPSGLLTGTAVAAAFVFGVRLLLGLSDGLTARRSAAPIGQPALEG